MLYREIEFNEIVGYVRRNLFGGILSLVIGV